MDTETDLGQPQTGTGIITRNPVAAGQRQLGAAAEGDDFLALIEQIRGLSKGAREGGDTEREALLVLLRNLDNEQLVPVARAFSQFLNLANIADQYNNVSRKMDPLLSASRNLAAGLRELGEAGVSRST